MNYLRRANLGILIALLLCLLAVWPLISRPGLPQDTDAELHVFRTAELSHLIKGGAFYPRWAPDFYFGYGYPIFNYYAPLVYYLGSALTYLPGVDAVLAVRIVFVLGLLAAGSGILILVLRHWGDLAGLVAAAAYVYAPYVQYIDPYARGVLAESFSLGLFPWVLWAFSAPRPDGSAHPGGRRRLPLAAALLAALITTHNLLALVLTAILAGWIAWQLCAARGRRPWWLLAGFGLGIALASFFWLPVVLEHDAVQLGNVLSDGGHFDFRNHFLSLGELLAPTPRLDLGASEPFYRFNLGVLQWLFALAGLAALGVKRTPERRSAVFFAVAAGILFFLLLPVSAPIWELVPLMPFLQFPWRLLGPLATCNALLAGLATGALVRTLGRRRATWVVGPALLLLLGLALPLSYPSPWPADFGPTDPAAIIRAERRGYWLGTTSTGDYVPIDVQVIPPPNDQVVESYGRPGPVDRVNRVTLPAGTTVVQTGDRPLRWTYQIAGDRPFVFRLFHFYFPGWTATLDGVPVIIRPAKPDGLMTIEVPAGEHTLTVRFGDTPARTAGWVLSALALMSLIVATWIPWPPSARRSEPAADRSGSDGLGRLSSPDARPGAGPDTSAGPVRSSLSPFWLLLPVALLLFKIAVADPLGWFRLQSTGLEALPADRSVYYEVGDEIALIGYDFRAASPGGTASLTLYWKALRPPELNYQVFVHLRDASGAVVAQSDKLNPGDFPARRWPLDRYVRDPHRLELPDGLPPGEYRLAVGLWRMAENERLPVIGPDGNLIGDSILLETVIYP